MKQWLNPLSVNPRLFGAGSIRKALRTIHRTAVRGIRVSTNSSHTLTASETLALDSTDYVGAFLFHGNNFDKYLFDGGYVTYSGSTPSLHFYLHDHQGNNRAVAEFATLSHVNASLSQTTYYYPYGGVFGDLGSYPESQPYKYNGKEFDRMHGLDWYDYGARQYDPAIARFTSMDPLAEKYYHISPYAYCAGNPVNYVDPDGRDWYQNNETQYYSWYEGNDDREGYTHIGGKGSVLGEFEGIIDNILCGDEGLGLESLYSEGFTFDIAPIDKRLMHASDERGGTLFGEFVTGTGPEFSVILENHPYTRTLKYRPEILKDHLLIYFGKTQIKGRLTDYGHKFWPWEAFPWSPLQVIGSFRYDGYTSEDGCHINNVVYDSKSMKSLFYHATDAEPRRSESRLLGNTYQFYIWQSAKLPALIRQKILNLNR